MTTEKLTLQIMLDILSTFTVSLTIRELNADERTMEDFDSRRSVYFITVTDQYGKTSEYARTTDLEETMRLIRSDLRNCDGIFF